MSCPAPSSSSSYFGCRPKSRNVTSETKIPKSKKPENMGRSMRSFREWERKKLQVQNQKEWQMTMEEKIRYRKHLWDEDVGKGEDTDDVREEVKVGDLASGRYIMWIIEVQSLTVIPLDYTIDNFSTDLLFNVTCFGRVVNVQVREGIGLFVIDDGTEQILITYDPTYLSSCRDDIVKIRSKIEKFKWSDVENEVINSILSNGTVLSESIKSVEQWSSIMVFGFLSERKESEIKFIIASYITRIDTAAEAALIQDVGSKY